MAPQLRVTVIAGGLISCSQNCAALHPATRRYQAQIARRAKHLRGCQPAFAKIFHFTEIRKWRMCCPSRLILEGRSYVVRFASRVAVDAAASCARGAGRAGSPCEPVATCRRAALMRTAKPCGPGRRCYGQAFAEVCASPTGRTAPSIRGAREARRKVRLPGEHGISRPTTAQGRPSVLAAPVCCCAVSFALYSRSRPRVRGQHPVFPAPSWLRGWSDEAKLGRNARRGREGVSARP
jgi:hypothetical protein